MFVEAEDGTEGVEGDKAGVFSWLVRAQYSCIGHRYHVLKEDEVVLIWVRCRPVKVEDDTDDLAGGA